MDIPKESIRLGMNHRLQWFFCVWKPLSLHRIRHNRAVFLGWRSGWSSFWCLNRFSLSATPLANARRIGIGAQFKIFCIQWCHIHVMNERNHYLCKVAVGLFCESLRIRLQIRPISLYLKHDRKIRDRFAYIGVCWVLNRIIFWFLALSWWQSSSIRVFWGKRKQRHRKAPRLLHISPYAKQQYYRTWPYFNRCCCVSMPRIRRGIKEVAIWFIVKISIRILFIWRCFYFNDLSQVVVATGGCSLAKRKINTPTLSLNHRLTDLCNWFFESSCRHFFGSSAELRFAIS